jgi:hypothetical protein
MTSASRVAESEWPKVCIHCEDLSDCRVSCRCLSQWPLIGGMPPSCQQQLMTRNGITSAATTFVPLFRARRAAPWHCTQAVTTCTPPNLGGAGTSALQHPRSSLGLPRMAHPAFLCGPAIISLDPGALTALTDHMEPITRSIRPPHPHPLCTAGHPPTPCGAH